MPFRRRYYWDLYRDLADTAGVPRAVWNMHARHGGTTEARQAGVALADVAEHAQHTDINTTRKHNIVPSVETHDGSADNVSRMARQRRAYGENDISDRIPDRFPSSLMPFPRQDPLLSPMAPTLFSSVRSF
jgi:hypothetical protein